MEVSPQNSRAYSVEDLTDLSVDLLAQGYASISESRAEAVGAWVDTAKAFVTRSGLRWRSPVINLDLDNKIKLDWGEGDNTLLLVFGPSPSFVKSTGEEEIEKGSISSPRDFIELWAWLHNK